MPDNDPIAPWESLRDDNRRSWDARTEHHIGSLFYDVPGFLNGGCSLRKPELELLGDVRGQTLLHLQCHFGLDTLSLARRGATVTGLDFSPRAVAEARRIAEKAGLSANFVESDVYRAPAALCGQRFDTVFTSYGVLGWLPDVRAWARVVADCLRPGGRLVLAEFHPVIWMFDDTIERITYPYQGGPFTETSQGTYAAPDATFTHVNHGWNHGLGSVVDALLAAGLELRTLREFDTSPYNVFHDMEEVEPGQFCVRRHGRRLPLMYALVATAPDHA